MTDPIRVGAVSYLNAKPLYYRLCDLDPTVRLSMEVPRLLAEQLAAGELDVALIPSVEYLRGVDRGYEIIDGFAIAAHGPVRSVKLFSRVPINRIERLALDEGSRTSQVLESTADAVLVIGDRAMAVPDGPFHEVVDLAEAWQALTGLPFVFALWVARAGVDLGDLPATLARSRALGLAHADDLARTHGPRLGLDFTTCYDYLTRILSYQLGALELAGLRRFAQMAAGLGLAPEGADLVFHRCRDLAARR